MFEKALDSLLRDYYSLHNRLEKGQEMLRISPKNEDYIKQYDYLDSLAFRASTCIDILNEDAVLITKPDGTLVVERKDSLNGAGS